MRATIGLGLAVLFWPAPALTAQDQPSSTCEWYLKNRPKVDIKIIAVLLGQDPEELEKMYVRLDRYCPEHPNEHLAWAVRQVLREGKRVKDLE